MLKWIKRIGLAIAIGIPAYLANLVFLGLLVSYFHFSGLTVLSPVIVADIFGVAVNIPLYPVTWHFLGRFGLFDSETEVDWNEMDKVLLIA